MKGRVLGLVAILVRAWARTYTTGMPAEFRNRRRAEIDSDIWESLHDPDHPVASATHMLVRCALGIPEDLSWRLEYGFAEGQPMLRKLALLCLAAAAMIGVLWSLSVLSRPLALPDLPSEPSPNYITRRKGPPPPPPPGPTWEEFVAKVNGKRP